MDATQWMTSAEAASYLGISHRTMAKLIRDQAFQTRSSQLDKRLRLVSRADVEHLKDEPRGRRPKERQATAA